MTVFLRTGTLLLVPCNFGSISKQRTVSQSLQEDLFHFMIMILLAMSSSFVGPLTHAVSHICDIYVT